MNETTGYSDLQLVEAVVLSQADALAEVYRRHAASVTSAVKMVLGNSSACDDVVAEVFLALWLKPGQFDPARGSLLGFLRMKARGRGIDLVRSEVARRQRERSDVSSTSHERSEPEQEFLTAEAAELIRKALVSLAESEREPIELAFFAGMTYRDVAKHLELPEGTVKTRIRKGLQQVKVAYESERHAEPESSPALGLDRGLR
jgi:RNA polymerase sigma-70 factor, ECF subfamily